MAMIQSTVLRPERYQDPHLEVDFARSSALLDARRINGNSHKALNTKQVKKVLSGGPQRWETKQSGQYDKYTDNRQRRSAP